MRISDWSSDVCSSDLRSRGEGSLVTVRGFGPEFNLVTVNGRQMPTSFLGDGASAPASRSFDFANLASEGVAGVEVYKSGRSEEHTSELQSLMRISYAVFCLKKKKNTRKDHTLTPKREKHST